MHEGGPESIENGRKCVISKVFSRFFEKRVDGRAFDDDNYNRFVGNKIVANVLVETGN